MLRHRQSIIIKYLPIFLTMHLATNIVNKSRLTKSSCNLVKRTESVRFQNENNVISMMMVRIAKHEPNGVKRWCEEGCRKRQRKPDKNVSAIKSKTNSTAIINGTQKIVSIEHFRCRRYTHIWSWRPRKPYHSINKFFMAYACNAYRFELQIKYTKNQMPILGLSELKSL